MSAVPPTPRVKLRTATRRVPRTRNAEADASAIPDAEPNMRLSRAILVMLLLHVVAVGGILAFSLIKERGHNHASANPASNAVEAEDSDALPAKVEGGDADHAGTDAGGTHWRAPDPHILSTHSRACRTIRVRPPLHRAARTTRRRASRAVARTLQVRPPRRTRRLVRRMLTCRRIPGKLTWCRKANRPTPSPKN